jgi:RHS repeat-associated protein
VPELFTERTRTIANPDGTYTLEASAGRLNYQDATGAWQPLDLTLVPTEGGTHDLRVAASDRAVSFGHRDAEVALAEVATDKGSIGLRALDFRGAFVDPDATSEGPAPTPTPDPTTQPTPSPTSSASELPAGSSDPGASAEPSSTLSVEPLPSDDPTTEPAATPGATAAPQPAESPTEVIASPVFGERALRFAADSASGQVVVQPTDDGFQFGVILGSPEQANTYAFALDLGDGLQARLADDGRTILLWQGEPGEAKEPAGVISAPHVLDANEVPAPPETVSVRIHEPGKDAAPSGEVSDAALRSLAPSEVVVIYTIDEAWLADPERVFPVTLDPSACLGAGASGCDINGTTGNADHFVLSGQPDNYATGWTVIQVGRISANYDRMRSLVYFKGVTLPDGAVVYDTNLRLHVSSLLGGASGQTINAYRINDGWDLTETWNEFDAGAGYDTTPLVTGTVPSSGNMNVDVDAIVQSWYTRRSQDWKPNIGIALRMASETDANGVAQFDRYNDATASYRPLLTITYQVPKVAIDFDPALGPNYAPSTMIAGQPTVLPLRVTNNSSGFDFAGSDWLIGYRWFDHKGKVVGTPAQQAIPCVGTGTGCANPSATFGLTVTPPATIGQYTLRLDLVRNGTVDQYASDWAKPSLFFSRNKKVLSADNTRWTGSSVIERDEFSIGVVSGSGGVGEVRSVETGDGGELGIDLWSRNLSYTAAGGVGFGDLVPIELEYTYDSKEVGDCAGILDACGWATNWDERLIAGSAGRYAYVDPSGNRYLIDSDADQQLVGGASVLLQRPRTTLFDEIVPSGAGATLVVPSFGAFSGPHAVRVNANGTPGVGLGTVGATNLNTYRNVRFAVRSDSAASSGVAFKIRNTTKSTERWFIYTVGTNWTTGFSQIALGQTITTGWRTYARNLYQDVRNDGNFGTTYDDFEVIAVQIQNPSGSASGGIYLDALRLEAAESTIIDGANPTWSSGGGLTSVVSGDAATGTTAVRVTAASISSSPDCTTTAPATPCWSTSAGGLYAFGFTSWEWKKVGGTGAAIVFHLKNLRTNATGDLTYYAGPTAPVGAVNPIQVSGATPVGWTRVTRNLLQDARQVLNFFNDSPTGTSSSSPPSQGPTPDDVRMIGYKVSGVDGNFLLLDDFRYGSLPDVAHETLDHPSSTTDSTFVYDFSATYRDGSVHYFNGLGLLERIATRDGHTVDLDWSIPTLTVTGPNAYRLDAIHAATDGFVSGAWTYDRELALSYGTSGADRTVTFTEKLGRIGAPITGRTTVFTISSANDVVVVKPARAAACAPSGTPAGCATFSYTGAHLLEYVGDPRWNQTTTSGANDLRFGVTWSGSDPASIVDRSTGGALLRVLSYDAGGALPAATRVAWQDAAAIRANHAAYADITSDGRSLYGYIPLACGAANCATLPSVSGLASRKWRESQFDGLARESASITYRCPGVTVSGCTGTTAQAVVSRQGTKAGAKVDNYHDPLTAGQVGWTQSPDQHVASLRDSGGVDPDLYRTFYRYDHNGQQTAASRPVHSARVDYPAAVKSTTQAAFNLKGYWRLGEASGSALDLAPTPNNGTYNGPTLSQPGALVNDANTAARFDGTNDLVTIPNGFGTVSGTFTVGAWVRPASATTTMAFIGSRKGDTATTDYTFDAKLRYASGVRSVRIDVGNGSAWMLTGDVPFDYEANRWYHIVAVVDDAADRVTVYANGASIGVLAFTTTTGTPRLADTTRLFKIGNNGRDSVTPEWFNGWIDEVAVWMQALTSAQVQGHYLAGHATTLETTSTLRDRAWRSIQVDDQFLASPGFESGLVDWDFGQGSGGVVYTAANPATDPYVHQPADPALPPSWASFKTNTSGNAQQDVQLVPGQTVRVQVWHKRVGTTGSARINLYYWQRSSASWQTLINVADGSTAWTGRAWDVTLPFDTDGRVRIALWASGVSGSDTIYFDDAAILTTSGRTTYTATPGDPFGGLIRDTITFTPSSPSGTGVAEFTERRTYDATGVHPPVFATATTVNYVDGAFNPAIADEDVTTTSTVDAWGRALIVTDADGVAQATTYVAATGANGYATDVASTADGLGQATSYTYDLVGNRLTETTPAPLSRTMTATYDLRNHVVSVQAPAPIGTVTRHSYDAYGFETASIENWIDGTPSGPSGLDDLTTSYAFDEYGFRTADTTNAGVTGTAAGRTERSHDLLGNTVAATVYATYNGSTFGSPRTTVERFEVVAGVSRPSSSASRGPGSFAATPQNAPDAPACPDGSGDRCNALMTLDQDGRTIALTDAYGAVTRTFLDIAGKTVISIANYADGVFDPAAPDTDLVTVTTNDLFGRAVATVDTLGRRTATTFDRLGRVTRVRTYDSAGVAVSDTRTSYTAAGRVDRVSLPGKAVSGGSDQPDAAFTWTKSVYDRAGKVVQTLAHYDISGAAGLAVASFERTIGDETIDGDGIAQRWSASADTFIAAGASIARDGSVLRTGNAGLQITLGTGANTGAQWYLDGTFKSGRTYRARVWVQPGGQTISARLGTLVSSSSVSTASGSSWQSIDLTWTPPSDQTGARIAIYRSATGAAAAVYADDVLVWDDATPDVNIPTETAYDAEGHIVASVVVPGTVGTADQPMVTATGYDALGRITSVTVNAIAGAGSATSDVNLTTLTSFDALGRADSTTDPTGTVTRAVYDRLGRQTSTIENDVVTPDTGQYAADDVTSTFAYNAAGDLVGYCPAAQVWATGCDPADSAEPQAWRYAFDDAGRLADQTPPVNTAAAALATTRWEYDAGGRLARSCDALATATGCGDTTPGAVLRTVVPLYDDVGRATRTDVFSGAGVTLALRNETSYFGDGKPKQVRYFEGSGPTLKDTLDFAYDGLGRETKVSRGTTVITERGYHEDGTVAWRRDGDAPNGSNPAIGQSDFTYDWAKRLLSVNLPDTFSTAVPTFSWRLDGLIAGRTWGAGTSGTFAYDPAKRPISFTKGALSISQTYDRDNNVVTEGRSVPGVTGDAGASTQTFTYDALNRLTGSSGLATGSRSYTYDRDGNRRTKTEGGVTFTYTVDRTDQLVSVIKTGGTTQSFTYDARGNLTGDAQTGTGVTTYTYDLANKLTGIDAAGTANDAAFTFDALGRFATRVLGGGTSTDTYSYAGTDEIVIRIATSTGTTTDSVVSSAGDRLGAKAGTTLNWFLPDLHGSIAASLDATEATVTHAIRYDAYGQTIATGSAGGTAAGERAWKYQGRLDIAPEGLATPLYDMSARFYAPGIGAFTQLDTVMGSAQDPLSMNRFLYAEANPATLTDPTGHFAFLALLVPVAIGFFAGAGIDAGVQQVTTGTVDWGQAAVSGVIGSVSGGTGGIAAAGAKSVVTQGVKAVAGTAARPVVTRVAAATTGAVVQTAVDQAIQTAALPPSQRDTGWQSGATSVTTQLGTEAAFEAGKHLPGRWGAAFRAFDAGLGGGRKSGGEPPSGGGGNRTGEIQILENDSRIRWVDERSTMSTTARDYQDRAIGARSNVATRSPMAPALDWTDASGRARTTRFDGVDYSGGRPQLIDRKLDVSSKSPRQAQRQAQALRHNGLTARWELPARTTNRGASALRRAWPPVALWVHVRTAQ